MTDLKDKTCCFAGHGAYPPAVGAALRSRAERRIKELYERGVVYYGCGGAAGFDTLMAQICFSLRESGQCPRMKVILVYPFDGFTKRWTVAQQETFHDLLGRYDKVVRLCKGPDYYARMMRNRYLVDRSGYCIAYCVETDGAAAYTIDYARKKGLEVINLALM